MSFQFWAEVFNRLISLWSSIISALFNQPYDAAHHHAGDVRPSILNTPPSRHGFGE